MTCFMLCNTHFTSYQKGKACISRPLLLVLGGTSGFVGDKVVGVLHVSHELIDLTVMLEG